MPRKFNCPKRIDKGNELAEKLRDQKAKKKTGELKQDQGLVVETEGEMFGCVEETGLFSRIVLIVCLLYVCMYICYRKLLGS